MRCTVSDQATGSKTWSDTGYLVTLLATTDYRVLRAQNHEPAQIAYRQPEIPLRPVTRLTKAASFFRLM